MQHRGILQAVRFTYEQSWMQVKIDDFLITVRRRLLAMQTEDFYKKKV